MFMLQEINNYKETDLADPASPLKNSVDFDSLKELSLALKLQSEDVVRHMLHVL